MTIFWILAAGLLLLTALFVAAPLLASRTGADDSDLDQDRINLELFKQQLAELDADLAAGKLERTQYEAARRDLERELLRDTAGLGPEDPKPVAHVRLPGPQLTAAALLLAVPLMALALYLILGERQIIPQLELAAAGAPQQQHAGQQGMPSLDVLVQRLEQRLDEHPEDGEGWTMLGRTYFAMRRLEAAEQSLARAHELLPDDVQVMLAYAESIAANNNSSLEGKPAALISEALAAEPDNATARWLSGMVAFQRGQFQSAAMAWKRVLEQVDPAGEDAAELKQLIAQAEQRAGIPPDMQLASNADGTRATAPGSTERDGGSPAPGQDAEPPAGQAAGERAAQASQGPAASPGPSAAEAGAPTSTEPASQPAAPAPSGPPAAVAPDADQPTAGESASAIPGVDVNVSLAPELAGQMPPGTTVFVFARAASGPPMPLAVQRLSVADLPATVRLDDSMAMMPAMRLSGFPQVLVGARVSPSGQAMPQPGDLEGLTGPISIADAGTVNVTIDRVRR
jgi:cytochrome c-type biogenesis protein CcmH